MVRAMVLGGKLGLLALEFRLILYLCSWLGQRWSLEATDDVDVTAHAQWQWLTGVQPRASARALASGAPNLSCATSRFGRRITDFYPIFLNEDVNKKKPRLSKLVSILKDVDFYETQSSIMI